ncbi:MAG: hypothetical protein JSW43_12550 [Gemmatimonadota bacterium]|nr:MAG: hypothetical protein JSW43_12550 [Gemmatimonadota bacterium]
MALSRSAANTIVAVIVLVGLAAMGGIIWYVEEPGLRLPLALLAMIPVMWALVWASKKGLTEEFQPPPMHKRRYLKLRSKVKMMIDEITRLHWTIVDGRRGLRPASDVQKEADQIEERLHKMIGDLRESAGDIAPGEDWD